MSFVDKFKGFFNSDSKSPDKLLLEKLESNIGQFIVKPNGSIALNLDNVVTQRKLKQEISKYRDFSVSSKG